MNKRHVNHHGRYSELKTALECLGDDFDRASEMYSELYGQLILAPDHKAPPSKEAWEGFVVANQGKLLDGSDEWERWDVLPNRIACIRFYGRGSKEAVEEFFRLADSASEILLSMQGLPEEGEPMPDAARLNLPSYKGPQDFWPGSSVWLWLDLVHCSAFSCRTMYLHGDYSLWDFPALPPEIEEIGRSGTTQEWEVALAKFWEKLENRVVEAKVTYPAHPHVRTLRYDLFRSSAEAIGVWLDLDSVIRQDFNDDPPIWLPPWPVVEAPEPFHVESLKGMKPKWKKLGTHTGELSIGDYLIKRYKQPAEAQAIVLETFELDGWPERIDDPLPIVKDKKGEDVLPKRRLGDTVRALNKYHVTEGILKFRTDGEGEGVVWELLTP